ncbi:MAG: DUF333 domain-containing protein [Nanoarchaeota archaeon]
MATKTLLAACGILTLILATISFAIANPAATYCAEQGYKNEIKTAQDGSQSGICVFTDGSSCDDWKFLRGECGPAKKDLPCKKSGEKLGAGSCCKGLVPITDKSPGEKGECAMLVGGSQVCAACGNGVCENGENRCNCPRDCKPCKKEGETVPVVPNAPDCCNGLTLLKPQKFPFVGVKGICSAKCGNSVCDTGTESESNCPKDCAPCKKEGESSVNIPGTPQCCAGLKLIKPRIFSSGSASGICTKRCGDGKCDAKKESAFNCPEDCVTCKKKGESIPSVRDPPKCCKGLSIMAPKEPLLGIKGLCWDRCGDGKCDGKHENIRNCASDCLKKKAASPRVTPVASNQTVTSDQAVTA